MGLFKKREIVTDPGVEHGFTRYSPGALQIYYDWIFTITLLLKTHNAAGYFLTQYRYQLLLTNHFNKPLGLSNFEIWHVRGIQQCLTFVSLNLYRKNLSNLS
jgi:hypothetical protein